MCRSVVVKGLEAMLIESLTTARRHGVEHGRRRAEEMREAAQTVREAGLVAWSADGTAERQDWVADLAKADVFDVDGGTGRPASADWRVQADRILAASGRTIEDMSRATTAVHRSDR
jgi:hypothetical protein